MSLNDPNMRLQAGDVKITNAILVNKSNESIDIKHIIREIKIFENIFSPFITGEATVLDSMAVSTMLPIVGEELLLLDIETPTGQSDGLAKRVSKQLAFHVYKMSNQMNLAIKAKMYTFHFISIDGYRDLNSAISQTFRGKISDLATKFIKESIGFKSDREAVVEETTNQIVYTSNFWSVSKNLFYLAENSLNEKSNANYLFFENAEGFVFASLDKLLEVPPQQQFFKDQYGRQSKETVNIDAEYQTILDMSTSENMFDYIDRKVTGGYGGTVFEIAWDTKSIKKDIKKFDEYETVDPNKVSPFSSDAFDPTSHILTVPVHRQLFNGSFGLTIDHHIKRAATLKHLENIQTNIQVFGRFDYTAGRQVQLTVYKDKVIDSATPDDVIEDELMSGIYLISSLCHVITPDKHYTNMELSKASMVAKPRS
jgi:hypothetical protein